MSLVLMACTGWPHAPGPAVASPTLPPAVQQALAAAGVAPEHMAAVALPLGHDGAAWSHRGEVAMQPGSTMKLVTSVVALKRLGPNHRGRTTFKSAVVLENGVLRGDLWLEGGADPDLGLAQFWALLMELRAQGLQRIEGDVVIDRRLFNPPRADLGVPPFDDAPEFGYNAVPDALGLLGGLLPVDLSATPQGALHARIVPPLVGIEVTSRMMSAADAPCSSWGALWLPPRVVQADSGMVGGTDGGTVSATDRDTARDTVRDTRGATLTVELQGRFPRGCSRRLALNVLDRQHLTEALFRTLWAGLGGQLIGRVREAGNAEAAGAEPASMRVLASRLSRPWGEVLRGMNKASDNPQTRLLYLTLGAAEAARAAAQLDTQTQIPTPMPTQIPPPIPPPPPMPPPAALRTTEHAERAVRQWFAEQRIAAPGLVLDNGSGLSRSERITPLTLAQMLQVAWAGRYASDFIASLPLAGEDGTMRLRLRQSPAAGWARLKTGTLRNVAALAGYVRDAQGRPWAVAMMINHERAQRARPALDALVDAMVRSRRPGEWAASESLGATASE